MATINPKKFIKPTREEEDEIEEDEREDEREDGIEQDNKVEKEDSRRPPSTISNPSTSSTSSTPSAFKPISKRDIDIKAEQLREAKKLPKIPGANVDFETFGEWLFLLTPAMWKRVMIYVYRLYPIIDRRRTGDQKAVKYINVISQHPSQLPGGNLYEYMKLSHGGGRYQFRITDTEKSRRVKGDDDPGVFLSTLEIPLGDADPILDYRELCIEERANLPYVNSLKAKGILDNMGQVVNQGNNQNNSPVTSTGDMVGVIKEVGSLLKSLNSDQERQVRQSLDPEKKSLSDSLGQLLLKKVDQEDPMKTITTVMGVIQGLQPKQDNSSNLEMVKLMQENQKMIISMQQENQKLVLEMMKAQMGNGGEGKEEKEESEFSKLEKLLDIADRLRGRGRVGGGEVAKTGWDYGMELARELGGPLLNTINNLMTMARFKGNQAGMGGGIISPNPIPTDPTITSEIPIPQNRVVEMPNQSMQQPGIGGPIGGSQSPSNQVMQFLNQYGGFIISKIQGGVPGWEFGQDVANMFGVMIPAMVKKMGSLSIVENAKQFPEFWNQVEPILGEDGVKQWIDDFIDYDKFDEEGNRIEEGEIEGDKRDTNKEDK